MPHVMFANADTQRRSDHDSRLESQGHLDSNVRHAAGVVLHGQMLKMLFRGSDRDDARLQLSRRHSLPKLTARVFAN